MNERGIIKQYIDYDVISRYCQLIQTIIMYVQADFKPPRIKHAVKRQDDASSITDHSSRNQVRCKGNTLTGSAASVGSPLFDTRAPGELFSYKTQSRHRVLKLQQD